MKKYKKFLFLFLIIVITTLSAFLYTTLGKGNSQDEKEKTLAEVGYLEKKIVTLLNELNNIESRNYNLSVSEISKEDSSQSEQDTQEKESKSNGEEESQDKRNQNSQEQGEDSARNSNTSSGEDEKNEEYTLKETGILANVNNIDWENLKTEVENLYLPVPTITLDLYSVEISRDDILGFNQELDNLTMVVKEENKEKTLENLSKLYEYIPRFAKMLTDNTTYRAVIETKNNLFKAYSKLDSKNWDEISNDLKQAIDTYSNQLINTNKDSDKQYVINKIYIMLNELQNAVNVQDESIFLIKYKNILEEMNNL